MDKNLSAEQWEIIQSEFLRLAEMTRDEREKALSEVKDEIIRGEIQKLLAAEDAESRFLESSPINAGVHQHIFGGHRVPEQIGRYKIEREIGFGGMGAVFLATRPDLENKRFALKTLKQDIYSTAIRHRFQVERKILASLEHPFIARLVDGGISDDETPFIVMEFIDGEDLISYARRKKLTVREKIELFRQICAAVSYAHQNLVVHRDLKPSNILIKADGTPKLLDFGISKILSETEPDEKGTATSLGMMTPAYASPEQFRGETVGTATDIYSLGVILYELLTMEMPLPLKKQRYDEAAKIISEKEPTAPSAAVCRNTLPTQIDNQTHDAEQTTQKNTAEADAVSRQMRQQTAKILRGDLDTIVLKALRKEIERRYASVEQFSEDLRRYLEGLPITARPDTFSYRSSKFIKRNRLPVAFAALLFFALVAGIAGTAWQAFRAERQRQLAEQRFAAVRQLANNIIFKYYEDIKNLSGATKTKNDIITDAASYLTMLESADMTDPKLKNEIGLAYTRLASIQSGNSESNTGNSEAALQNLEKAVRFLTEAEREAPSDNYKMDLMSALNGYGMQVLKTRDFKKSQKIFNQVIEISETLSDKNGLNARRPDGSTPMIILGTNFLSLCQSLTVGFDENESLPNCRKANEIFTKQLEITPDTPEFAAARFNIWQGLTSSEQQSGISFLILAQATNDETGLEKRRELFRQAVPHFAAAIEYTRKMLEKHSNDQRLINDLIFARLYGSTADAGTGETAKALKTQFELYAQAKKISAEDPQNVEALYDIFRIVNEIGQTYWLEKEFTKSLETFDEGEKRLRELVKRDENNAEAQVDFYNLLLRIGEVYLDKGDYKNASVKFEQASQFVESAKMLRGTPYEKYNEAAQLEEKGLSYRLRAQRDTNLPEQTRFEMFENCAKTYRAANEIWQANVSDLSEFGGDEDRIGKLTENIKQCETLAARLKTSK